MRRSGLAAAILLIGLLLPGAAQAACTINITLPANTADNASAILTDAWDAGCTSATTSGFAGPLVVGYEPAHGVVDFENRRYTTQFRYTPQLNFVGMDSFRLKGDQQSGEGRGIVIVNVTVTARAPVTANGVATVAYNSSGNAIPLSFTGVGPTAVAVIGSPSHGTAAVSGTSILYTPTPGFAGADSLTYRGSNSAGPSNTSTVSITVTAPPAPVAGAFTAPAGPYNGSARTFSLAGQASNGPTGYAVGSATTSGGGEVSIDASGVVTYRPAAGYRGSDTFTYTATNPGGASNPATVTIPVGDPVLNATLTGSGARSGVALSGYAIVSSGGRAPYSCATTVASGALPAGVSLNADCSLSGTPTQSGPFTFAVRITDSSLGLGPFEQGVADLDLSIQLPTPTVAIGAPANGATLTTYDATVSGTAQNATSVTLTFQGNSYGPIAVTGGAWSQALPGPLANGAYSFTAVSTNGTENSAVATSGFTVAVAAPAAPVITAPSADQMVASQTPVISGTSASNARVTVREGSTVLATATATASGGGAWSVTSVTLAQGRRTITATAADAAGNTSTSSSSVSFTVDTVAPPAPTIAAPGSGQMLTTATPTLSGTAEAGATVTVRDGLTVIGTTTASGGGAWSLASAALAEGSHTVAATAIDGAGNTSSPSTAVSFTVDTGAPSAPVVTTPVDNASLTQTTPTYAGTAEAGATVAVIVDGTSIGTAIASGAGAWSKIQPTALAVGAHTVRATATDGAGNVSLASAMIGFTVVAAPSATPQAVTTPYNTVLGIVLTGSNASSYTVVSTPAHGMLSGTAPNLTYTPTAGYAGADSFQFTVGNAGGTSAPATISISVGAVLSVSIITPTDGAVVANPEGVIVRGAAQNAVSVVLTVNGTRYGQIAVSGGTWSQVLAPARLPNGVYSVSAVSTDGTADSPAATTTFTVAAPTVMIGAPAAGDQLSDPNAVIVSGTAENAASVQLTVNGVAYDSVSVAGGSWSQVLSPARLPNGTYALSAVSTGGGVSSPPATASFTVAGPTVSIISPSNGATAASPNVTVTGVAANAASVTLTFQGATYGPIPVNGGAWSQALPGSLSGGAYSLSAVATNGSVSSATVSSTFNVSLSSDSRLAGLSVPNVILSPAFSSTTTAYSAAVANDVTAITVVPTVAESAARVTVNSASVTSGAPSAAIGLTVGANTVTVTVTPPAGSASTYTIIVERLPGAPTAAAVQAGIAYNSPGQTIALQPGGVFATVAVVTPPTQGTVRIEGATATYVPTTGYHGVDSFTYAATGPGGVSAPATVSLTIARPDAPAAGSVTATVAFASVGAQIALAPSGAYSSLSIVNAPGHGVVTISGTVAAYTPTTGYSGPDGFTYAVTGPGGISAPATVSITVTSPDVPTVSPVNQTVAYGSTGQAITLLPTGAYSALTIVTPPTHGAVTIVGTTATYMPETGYSGSDSFTYGATGPGGISAPARVDLTIAAPPPPVITPPTTPILPTITNGSGSATVELGTSTSGEIDGYRVTTEGLQGSAVIETTTVGASSAKTGAALSAPAVSFRLVYTPRPDFMGVESVTLVAYGPGGVSAPVTFTFHVAGKAPDTSARTASGQAVAIAPTAGLAGGPFQGLRITRAPGFGTAVVQGLTIVFTPGLAEAGATSLDYVVQLAFGESAAGRIDLISGLSPTAPGRTARTLQGRPVTVRLSDGAQGGPFIGAAVTRITPVGSVTAQVVAAGGGAYDVTVTPEASFSGEAVVAYSLTNAQGAAAGLLTVTVDARPNPALDPEVSALAGGQVQSARRFADSQIDNVQQRLGRLHHGDNRSSNSLSLNPGQGDTDRDPRMASLRRLGAGGDSLPGDREVERERELIALSAGARDVAPTDGPDTRLVGAPTGTGDGVRPLGVWTSGSVDWGHQDASGLRDSRFTTQGVTVGADLAVTGSLTLGAAAGYGEDTTRAGASGTRSKAAALSGMVYGSWRPVEGLYLDGMAGYSDLSFDSRRWAAGLAGEADAFAHGSRSGGLRFVSGTVGRTGDVVGVPGDLYARVDARRIDLDAFVETGAGLASLAWDPVSQDSVSGSLGAVLRWTVETRRHGLIRPEVRVEWSHEFESLNDQAIRYAGWAASPRYQVAMDGWSRDALRLNLGGEWTLSERLMVRLGYRGALGDAGQSHGAELGVTLNW